MPTGAGAATQSTPNAALTRAYVNSGSQGLPDADVTYTLALASAGPANLPAGNYSVVVQYTATTDS